MASFETDDPAVWVLGFGALGLTARGVMFALDLARRRGKVRCEATLVDHEPYASDGETYYHRIFEFRGPDGTERRTVVRSVGYPQPGPIDGSMKTILYFDPSDDAKTYIDPLAKQKLQMTFMPFVFLAVGAALWFYRHR